LKTDEERREDGIRQSKANVFRNQAVRMLKSGKTAGVQEALDRYEALSVKPPDDIADLRAALTRLLAGDTFLFQDLDERP
jgi:DnaJ-domain-containing protein 1